MHLTVVKKGLGTFAVCGAWVAVWACVGTGSCARRARS